MAGSQARGKRSIGQYLRRLLGIMMSMIDGTICSASASVAPEIARAWSSTSPRRHGLCGGSSRNHTGCHACGPAATPVRGRARC